ncbi:MAG: hypothetical protein AAFQ41_10255 [Cyanobacteria bacterium J06623_7]
MKLILYLTTVPVICLAAAVVQAQTAPSNTLSPTEAGNLRQFPQSGGFFNSNNSSRQFFQQGRDKLYFLEDSDSILQINRDISRQEENEPSTIEEDFPENQLEIPGQSK